MALAVALTVLVVYPLSALVLSGPKTPITFQLFPTVSAYMHPHFPQNWSLFAPDPISEERGALARFRCGDGAETTPWQNITRRGIDRVQDTRLFPSRESRIVSNSIITRFRKDDVVKRADERRTSDDNPVLDPLRKASATEQRQVERVLARYATARHPGICGGAPADEVQIRFVFHRFPGWSSRDDLEAIGEVDTVDTEWMTP
ncbi:DUF5819 family protein [Knoellia remsis]|uniref:DUF5819 family protein n=1 Tax=Knoellia remsis TaxID=407159 RepID=UPI0011B26096|nr:DUF5819 family protein [Knoellia remsis]